VAPTYRGRTYEQLAGAIDHSLLRPELTLADVEAGCAIAVEYRTASVCCRPADVALVASLLAGGGVAVGTVVAFPHGAATTATKVFETTDAIRRGASEIDMVQNVGWARSARWDDVEADVRAVVDAAREAAPNAVVKVILENAYLDDAQKVEACRRAESAGADFVKTSTGFAPSGATPTDLALMRRSVSDRVRVKAAGGVRTLDALVDVIEAGATRCGATATQAILDEFRARAS
jgi:deoxyribose-phosphate aldolase